MPRHPYTPPRHIQTPSRHPQTPSRHPRHSNIYATRGYWNLRELWALWPYLNLCQFSIYVLRVFGGCLGLSWQCLGDFIQVWGCVIQTFWQKFELSEYVQRLPFLPNPSSCQCVWMPISWGVCMVSGGVWMVCKSVWGCIKSNLLGKCYIRSLYSDIAFPSNALYLCKKRLCMGVSGWCLYVSGGV